MHHFPKESATSATTGRGFVFVLLLAALGCSRSSDTTDPTGDVFLKYTALPGLAQSHHMGLQNELALLQAEKATPKLLDERQPERQQAAGDLLEALDDAFNPSSLKFAGGRVEKLFDGPTFAWDPINLERAFRLRDEYDPQRVSIRSASMEQATPLPMQYSRGMGIDLQFIDAARLYNRLEMFQAAEQLTGGDVAGAVETLTRMLALTERLAQQKHVVSRMAACENRREAWQILQAIVSHSAVSPAQLQQLRMLVDGQLSRWPPDGDCWIGDRAVGLHMYEMIRDGHLLSILSEVELVEFRADGTLDAFTSAAIRSIDEDEHFYLSAMRRIIANSELPYPKRGPVFDEIRHELNERRESPTYPLIADRLLLQGVEEGQRKQAADRAWATAWALALRMSTEGPSSSPVINPLTGKEFRVQADEHQLTISDIDPLEPDVKLQISSFNRAPEKPAVIQSSDP